MHVESSPPEFNRVKVQDSSQVSPMHLTCTLLVKYQQEVLLSYSLDHTRSVGHNYTTLAY